MSTRDQVVDLPVCGCGAVAYIHHRACPLIQAVEDLLAAAESRAADLQAENARLREMVVCFYDPSPCWFDHHGGCQAHGFLDLEAGETCPNEEARALVGDETPGTGAGA